MLDRIKYQLHRRQYRERYRMLDELLSNQTLSRAQLLLKQQRDLSSIIQHAYSNTPYYHEKYADYMADNPHQLQIDKLPILHKNEVVKHKDAMLARDADRSTLSIGNTGGSTGKPVSFYYDQHKHELMRAGMIRSYMWSGWQPGQKILNFWGARQDIQHGSSLGKKYQDYIAAEETIAAYEYSE